MLVLYIPPIRTFSYLVVCHTCLLDKMDNSNLRGVYALGVLQFVIMGAVCFFYPPLPTLLLTFTPSQDFNVTHHSGVVHTFGTALGLPCMVVSASVMGFVSASITLDAGGYTEQSYTQETLAEVGPWNICFWFVVTGIHLVCVLSMCSPADVFACAVAVYAMVRALHCICSPTNAEELSIMRVNSAVAGYVFGLGVALYCVPAEEDNRYISFFLLGLLDYILVVGHTWDKSPTVKTVANCRLSWALAASLCMGAMYGGFHDHVILG